MTKNTFQKASFLIVVFAITCLGAFAQSRVDTSEIRSSLVDAAADSVVTVILANEGQAYAVGSGAVVRSDGFIVTPLSLVKGAREIQIRLRNGETYDKAELVSTDERRNIAILHINASGLQVIPNGTAEEGQVGSTIYVFANPSGNSMVGRSLVLNSVQMADSVPGAGKGYRLLQFEMLANLNIAGGLVFDEFGRTLGFVTTTPEVRGQNIAVPFSSIYGLIRSAPTNYGLSTASTSTPISSPTSYSPPAPSNTPYPIPQGSVLVPQRGVTPLSPKGPGSVVVKPHTAQEVLAAAKTIYVTSGTVSFKPDYLVNELNKRQEMQDWGLSFVDERDLADLILEIDHVLYTWKYTFKLYSARLGVVVASGSKIIWDGNLGAPFMADRVIEKLKIARGSGPAVPPSKEPEPKKDAEKKKDSK